MNRPCRPYAQIGVSKDATLSLVNEEGWCWTMVGCRHSPSTSKSMIECLCLVLLSDGG